MTPPGAPPVSRRALLFGAGAVLAIPGRRSGAAPIPSADVDAFALADFKGASEPDWSSALIRFNREARRRSLLGNRIELVLPAGRRIEADSALTQGWLTGLRDLHVKGYGSTFRNTHAEKSGYDYPWNPAWFGRVETSGASGVWDLIADTPRGATSVTLRHPGRAARYPVGRWVLIAGLDVQYYGYPPNCYHFDFREVTDNEAGRVTFAEPLRYDYRATWPDGPPVTGVEPAGRARVFLLEGVVDRDVDDNGRPSGPAAHRPLLCFRRGDIAPWSVRHIYEGLDIELAASGNPLYITATGLSQHWINCRAPGWSESICRHFVAEGCEARTVEEPDKLVESSARVGHRSRTRLVFQSASIDDVTIRNSAIGYLASNAKHTLVEDVRAEYWSLGTPGARYGDPLTLTARRLRVDKPIPDNALFGQPEARLPIDGRTVSYARGIFSFSKRHSEFYRFNAVPGQRIALTGPGGNVLPGGVGRVLAVTGDETGAESDMYHVATTLPFATLPAWASGSVAIFKEPSAVFELCSGGPALEAASAARALGRLPGEYQRAVLTGRTAAGGSWPNLYGQLERLRVTVTRPAANKAARLILGQTAYATRSQADPRRLELGFDLGTSGVSDLRLGGAPSKRPNGAIRLGTVPLTALPPGRWCVGLADWRVTGYDPARDPAAGLPSVRLEWFFDHGPLQHPGRP